MNLFIYEPIFQVSLLLVVRIMLCFMPNYWLINLAMVYFIIQVFCAFDFSQSLLVNLGVIRDEQESILKLYKMAPLLQAKTMQQLPELRCEVPDTN